MELSLDALTTFQPKTGTLDDWNAAYLRLEEYLRAHRIHHRLHQSRLIHKILLRAARRHEAQPARDPTSLAIEEADAMMQAWFGALMADKAAAPERINAEGRMALLLSDAPQRWPVAFLDEDNIPMDLIRSLQASALEAGPELAVSSMVPRPIDLGPITSAAGETLERFERWPILRTLVLWSLFLGALAAIFHLTR